MIRENVRTVPSGYLMLVVLAVAQIGFGYAIFRSAVAFSIPGIIGFALASVIVAICWAGLFMVHPNEAKVLQLFGKYVGTTHMTRVLSGPTRFTPRLRYQHASGILKAAS